MPATFHLRATAKVFDDRIVSRLAAGTVFTLKGRDRRLEGKRA